MSETVRYIGKLTPTGKTLAEYDPQADDICDNYYYKAVEIEGGVYEVSKTEIDFTDDVFEAVLLCDGSIEFEVQYYNGGCSFNEAIEEAVKGVNINKNGSAGTGYTKDQLEYVASLEKKVRDSEIKIKTMALGVSEIMEHVDEDGWAYGWCKEVLK